MRKSKMAISIKSKSRRPLLYGARILICWDILHRQTHLYTFLMLFLWEKWLLLFFRMVCLDDVVFFPSFATAAVGRKIGSSSKWYAINNGNLLFHSILDLVAIELVSWHHMISSTGAWFAMGSNTRTHTDTKSAENKILLVKTCKQSKINQ